MTLYRHGLVIGKFYPPTLGHRHLIRTAGAQADRVTVVVMAECRESIPMADRVRWLKIDHEAEVNVSIVGAPCDVPVDYGDATIWAAQVAVMAAAVRTVSMEPIDAVFTSEPYGDELARRFAAAHVSVDLERCAVPISASQVRSDLPGGWDWLSPPVRAGLATRVVFVGAESTGTTTISRLLTDHYCGLRAVWARTQLVTEYGREYTDTKWTHDRRVARRAGLDEPQLNDLVWSATDFDQVAAEQDRREQAAALVGSPLLICDTDAFATAVWERRYLGGGARQQQPWAVNVPGKRTYFVTDHEGVPWINDGMREGDLMVRAAMTRWFMDALTAAGHSWVLLSGTIQQRLLLAIRTCDQLLAHASTF